MANCRKYALNVTGTPAFSLEDVIEAISAGNISLTKQDFIKDVNQSIESEQEYICNSEECKKPARRRKIDYKYYEKAIKKPNEYTSDLIWRMKYNNAELKYNNSHIHPKHMIFPEGTYFDEDDIDRISYFSYNDNTYNIIMQEVLSDEDNTAPNTTFCLKLK